MIGYYKFKIGNKREEVFGRNVSFVLLKFKKNSILIPIHLSKHIGGMSL